MASNYTRNYNLCQWEAEDKVLRTEFNADNAKIDAALAGKASQSAISSLQTALAGKADVSALDSLKSTVTSLSTSKADKTALDNLKTTITSQGTNLALRNCQFVTGTYAGTGKTGPSNPSTLTFPYKPVFLHVANTSEAGRFSAVLGMSEVFSSLGGGANNKVVFTWENRSVSWYNNSGSASGQLNDSRSIYYYFAILEVK